MSSRIRKSDSMVEADLDRSTSYTDQNGNSGTTPRAWSDPAIKVGTSQITSDIVTPRFKERSLRGEIFNNPFSTTRESRRVSPGKFAYYKPESPQNYVEDWPEDFSMFHPWLNSTTRLVEHLDTSVDIGDMQLLAGTRAHANIDPDVFASWVFLGELRETVSFLRNPLKAWSDLVREIRNDKNRSRFNRTKATIEFLRDQWLSYRYAVRPIISDAHNAVEAFDTLTKGGTGVHKRQTARASEQRSDSVVSYETLGFHDRVTRTTQTVSVRCGVLYRLDYSPDTLGLRPSKVPLAIWELVPYSFVVDWFANVGPYISAITPKFGVEILAEWTTTTDKRDTLCSSTMGNLAAPRVITVQEPGEYEINTRTVTRNPAIDIGLTSKFSPFIGEDYKLARIVDSLALVHGAAQRMLMRR